MESIHLVFTLFCLLRADTTLRVLALEPEYSSKRNDHVSDFFQRSEGGHCFTKSPQGKEDQGNYYQQPTMQVISQYPRIHLYKNCISTKQRKQLLDLAAQKLTQETNSGFSSSLYLNQAEDSKREILREIAQLAGDLSGTPWKYAEPVSLTKYTVGQNYGLHYDSGYTMKGKQMTRIATFLIYLNNVEKGGETIFPYATNDTKARDIELGDIKKPPLKDVCNRHSIIKVAAEASSCLVFWNHIKGGDGADPLSLHGSCPVISDEKWIAQIWLHHKHWGDGVTDFWKN